MQRLIEKRSIHKLRNFDNLTGWLWRIASNEASDFMSNKHQDPHLSRHETSFESVEDITAEAPGSEISASSSGHSILTRITSPRDRAIIRLAFGFEPRPDEWEALSVWVGRSQEEIRNEVEPLLYETASEESRRQEKVVELYSKVLHIQKQLDQLQAMRLEPADHDPPSDFPGSDQDRTIEKLRAAQAKAYNAYRKVQDYKIPHVPAKKLATILNLEENAIHQIISRARRKLR